MEIDKIINQRKLIYSKIISFVDQLEEIQINWEEIKDEFNQLHDILEQKEEIIQILRIINKISQNHYRDESFFDKIKLLILYFKKDINQNFTNLDLLNLFKNNNKIILELLKIGFVTIESAFIENILKMNFIKGLKKFYFFYPEIQLFEKTEKDNILNTIRKEILKKYISSKNKNDLYSFNFSEMNENMEIKQLIVQIKELMQNYENLKEDFVKMREIGENEIYFCSLIRQDLVDEFIIYVNRTNLSLSKKVKPSLFETNLFLIDKEATLIEYAAFFGSIQIFNYLRFNNVEINPTIWLYAIHSKNPELIHILEENSIEPNYKLCIKESIKCHHNDIKEYIETNFSRPLIYDMKIASYAFHYYNYEYIHFYYENFKILCCLIKYDYYDILKLYLENHSIDVNMKIVSITKFLRKFFFFTLF